MKRTLIFATLLVSIGLQAQKSNTKQRILIGYNLSPDYSSRTLKNNDGSSGSDLVIKSRNAIETGKFGYTTGLNAWFNHSQAIGFETGIQFSNKGYKIKNHDLVYIPPANNLPTKSKTTYSYHYIGVPLKAKFLFGKNNVHFFSSVGFVADFLLTAKRRTTYEYSDNRTENITESTSSGFKKVNISPLFSAGIDYKLKNGFHLFAEPTFRYGLLKTTNTPVSEKLWAAGLNIGFYHPLK